MPLTSPTAPPASTPAATPTNTLCVAVISTEATTPENATIDATDRSTSPSASTNIIVTEIEPISVTDSSRPWILRVLRKSGTVNDSTANRMTNTITMPDLLIRSQVRAARAVKPAEATAGVEESVEGVFMMSVPFNAIFVAVFGKRSGGAIRCAISAAMPA
ncbi:hypothetical protein OKW43_002736 [Paraburkholderia sp. WC7.3g]